MVSVDAGILYANAAAAALLDSSAPEALVGRSIFGFVPRSMHQLMQQHRFLVECGEVPPPLDLSLPTAGAQRRTVRLRSTPVCIDGRYAMHTVLHDVSAQRAREQALRDDKEHAVRMNRLKSRFLAQMSHEIRTPLTTIIGFAEILNENDLGTLNEFATYIEQSSRRLLRTINSVLNLSRLETGTLELTPTLIDVSATVQQAAELFRYRAASKSVQLQVEVPSSTLHVHIDEKALDRILDNLIGNAVKFTREGGRVTVRARHDCDHLVIEVEDTGVGIAPQFIPHLFEAFKQGHADTPDDQAGSGLGLAITHQLVELMNGTIEVESETGVGSRFTVTLPMTSA
jgi:signal transduction histidine kinase